MKRFHIKFPDVLANFCVYFYYLKYFLIYIKLYKNIFVIIVIIIIIDSRSIIILQILQHI